MALGLRKLILLKIENLNERSCGDEKSSLRGGAYVSEYWVTEPERGDFGRGP